MAHGEHLVGGKVAETCEGAGMKAVCFGDDGCTRHNDISRFDGDFSTHN